MNIKFVIVGSLLAVASLSVHAADAEEPCYVQSPRSGEATSAGSPLKLCALVPQPVVEVKSEEDERKEKFRNGQATIREAKALNCKNWLKDRPDRTLKDCNEYRAALLGIGKLEVDLFQPRIPLRIGMSEDAMWKTVWGNRPNTINRTITATSVSEQWVYDGRGYLYFTNGRLTAIQD